MSSSTSPRGNVLLCVTGCIAAYKACEVLRLLQKAGCDVRVAMTRNACDFVGPTTMRALSGHNAACELVGFSETAIPHIEMTEWADVVAVVPATGNILAKMACGIADDCVSSALLAATGPVLVAPAMNVHMWDNPATQANVSTLRERGIQVIEPDTGRLACGDVGRGKLPEVDTIATAIMSALEPSHDFDGVHVMVTAGPTHEAIDPVRYLSNASSGKMGYAIAAAATTRGAKVTLVSGPVSLDCPEGVERVDVVSAHDMLIAATKAFETADVAICAAAVADFTPATVAPNKLKKRDGGLDAIELVRTDDILATLGASKGSRVVVGFAAETQELLANAQEKLATKGCDLIVANDVSRADSTFGSDTDRVTLVMANDTRELPCLPKPQVADAILDEVIALRESRTC